MLGKHHSDETKRKMSSANLGRESALKGKQLSEETKKKIGLASLGKPRSLEVKIKISNSHRAKFVGKESYAQRMKYLRASFRYKEWRTAVFKRDDWTCQFCGVKGGKLQADHIKPFSLFPDLHYEITNGRTLCRPCHFKTDTYGAKGIRSYQSRLQI